MSDFEDDDDFDPCTLFRLVESKPMTPWTFLVIFLNFWVSFFRNMAETFGAASDAVLGHEGYERHKKDFADEVRAELEALPASNDE